MKQLEKDGFLVERLGADKIAGTGSRTYMGICALDKKHLNRRIDIKVYPKSQYGYAILYFTGSRQFNVNMRNQAIAYGYSLSDAGIKFVGWQKDKPSNLDSKIEKSMRDLAKRTGLVSEEDIMKAFGMKYHTPAERAI